MTTSPPTAGLLPPPTHHTVQSGQDQGQVRLAATCWDHPGRPTLVLVHGYPDNQAVWSDVIEHLRPHFRLVAYDVRGAGGSDRPRGVRSYRLDRLREDFQAVVDHFSPREPVHVLAHDWGSVQTWESVTEPALAGRIASFTSCSGPCLDHMGHWNRQRLSRPTPRHLGQLLLQAAKSWYVYMFHLPLLPELQWRHLGMARAWPTLVRWLEGTRIPVNPTQADDGAFGVNLYRANVFPRLLRPRRRVAHCPVQVIVPLRDLYVSPALAEGLQAWVPQLVRRDYRSGHWMPHSHPAEMASAVTAFVAQLGSARRAA